jgi:hypothetical protein
MRNIANIAMNGQAPNAALSVMILPLNAGLNVGIDRRDPMRNRAKCKLCGSVLESFHRFDYVVCKCGEIAIDGGLDYMRAVAKNFDNFLRVDDDDHEVHVEYKEKTEKKYEEINEQEQTHKPSKEELIRMLDEMVKSYEKLPQHVMLAPVSHADQLSLLMLVSSLFKSI